jgi:flagellar capping protein FliD
LVSEQQFPDGSTIFGDSMADDTRMNQLTESFAALKKTMEKNEAQAEKKYNDLLKNMEEMQKKMERMQTSSDGDKKN